MNSLIRFFVSGRIPVWLKLLYTAFVAVMVPTYWKDYGPTNFLYFCDVAVLMTLVAMWTESAFWASTPLVGILAVQTLWMIDFFAVAAGCRLVGMTNYMFDERTEFFLRALSFFHFWLPWLLLYMVWKVGYDRRAGVAWCSLGAVLLLISYFLLPKPPAPESNPNLPVNVNYVWGFNDEKPQEIMDGRLYFCIEFFGLPLLVWLPTHLALCKFFDRRRDQARPGGPRLNGAQ